MVRWWWNGNAVEAGEIKRELRLLHEAGIGGVEINSIAMPPQADMAGARPLQWAGPEWCRMVKVAALEAKELGMITDLIVGSGWPFGGRFLKEDEIMQRLGVKRQYLEPNTKVNIDLDEYLKFKSHFAPGAEVTREFSDVELISVKLIPTVLQSMDEVVDIGAHIKDNRLVYLTDNKPYILVFVYNERNFKSVYHGSPGADGPIMDHFKEEAVLGYLNRLKAIEKETGIPLAELIRALFCDSIELGGSNWTDDMAALFMERNAYDISPYLPFVIRPAGVSNLYEASGEMADILKRVQFDFYNTLINVFLERFTQVFQEFCAENGVLCRYQAYGTPYYMGLFQGNMIPDIPESNSWVYSRSDEARPSEYEWAQGHGYMLWNKAASAGAHIKGRKITSCEAITNTKGVFRTSLETVKQSDDMSFITGINHTVLHGFNYSPPEAGFPGWVRYGTYFSEQNPWWQFFRHWADYNSRLSSVFQNSRPEVQIVVLSRLQDFWGEEGPARPRFNTEPWYYARLWEPLSNFGSSCDYIHQGALEDARIEGETLVCGKMRYRALILTDVNSLSPGVAQKIRAFAEAGGRVVFIGALPQRSLSLVDAKENDRIVKGAIGELTGLQNVIRMEAPAGPDGFIDYTARMMDSINLEPQVKIARPVSNLYFMKQSREDMEIYFFNNSDRRNAVDLYAEIEMKGKIPYIWDPHTGNRSKMHLEDGNALNIRLDALESVLVVCEHANLDLPFYRQAPLPESMVHLDASWDARFMHVDGSVFERKLEQLINFRDAEDNAIRDFAGTVSYSSRFENPGNIHFIRLTEVNEGVSELVLNGKKVGMKWYGNHCYDVSEYLRPGENRLEIRITNTLANYCGSLAGNPVASAWTRSYETPVSSGLEGVEIGE